MDISYRGDQAIDSDDVFSAKAFFKSGTIKIVFVCVVELMYKKYCLKYLIWLGGCKWVSIKISSQ